jgi:hypothetical protein
MSQVEDTNSVTGISAPIAGGRNEHSSDILLTALNLSLERLLPSAAPTSHGLKGPDHRDGSGPGKIGKTLMLTSSPAEPAPDGLQVSSGPKSSRVSSCHRVFPPSG